MNTALLDQSLDAPDAHVALDKRLLFQVWIDLNNGVPPFDWWWNTPPQPLGGALKEAAETRSEGWIVVVMPEGQNPRIDGRWDNP